MRLQFVGAALAAQMQGAFPEGQFFVPWAKVEDGHA